MSLLVCSALGTGRRSGCATLIRLPLDKGAVAAVEQGHGQQQADHRHHIVPKQEQDSPDRQPEKQSGLVEKVRTGGEGTTSGNSLPNGENNDAQEPGKG